MNHEELAGDGVDTDRQGYDGNDRRSWREEADFFNRRLGNIEDLLRDTQALSRSTHETIISHVSEERETKLAIDELLLLWKGSKLVVATFKFLIPVVAGVIGMAIWAKDHVKW